MKIENNIINSVEDKQILVNQLIEVIMGYDYSGSMSAYDMKSILYAIELEIAKDEHSRLSELVKKSPPQQDEESCGLSF